MSLDILADGTPEALAGSLPASVIDAMSHSLDEADKWKRLSRKNEAMARLNMARAILAESKLALALAPRDRPADIAALNRQIEKNAREFRFWQQMMTDAPWVNRHSGRLTAEHRS